MTSSYDSVSEALDRLSSRVRRHNLPAPPAEEHEAASSSAIAVRVDGADDAIRLASALRSGGGVFLRNRTDAAVGRSGGGGSMIGKIALCFRRSLSENAGTSSIPPNVLDYLMEAIVLSEHHHQVRELALRYANDDVLVAFGNALARVSSSSSSLRLDDNNRKKNNKNRHRHRRTNAGQKSSLQVLALSNCRIGSSGASALAKGLRRCESLLCFHLSGALVVGDRFHLLASALKDSPGLLSVRMSSLVHVSAADGDFLRQVASPLRADRLVSLDLSHNHIGDQGAWYVGDVLKTNKSLVTLVLGANGIGDRGCMGLAVSLRKNATLRQLQLGDNAFTNDGASMLERALRESNYTLLYLDFVSPSVSADDGDRARYSHSQQTRRQQQQQTYQASINWFCYQNRLIASVLDGLEGHHQHYYQHSKQDRPPLFIPDAFWDRAFQLANEKPELLYSVLRSMPTRMLDEEFISGTPDPYPYAAAELSSSSSSIATDTTMFAE